MVDTWSKDDVADWLLREGFGQYRANFLENGVDGRTLRSLTQADLKAELEIPVLQDRKDIWAALQHLLSGYAPTVAAGGSPGAASRLYDSSPRYGGAHAGPGAAPASPSPSPYATTFVGGSPAAPPLLSASVPRYPSKAQLDTQAALSPASTSIYTGILPPSSSTPPRNPSPMLGHTISEFSSPPSAAVAATAPRSSPLSSDQVCNRCKHALGVTFVRAFEKVWHEDCFLCTKCNIPIRDTKYASEGGLPYHADCLAVAAGDICWRCHRAIIGTVTNALGKKWHLECFVCGTCGRPITDKTFSATGLEAYHTDCSPPTPSPAVSAAAIPPPRPAGSGAAGRVSPIPRATDRVCQGCQRNIEGGTTTTALGKIWHSDCFACIKCNKPIREDKFKTEDNQPCHVNCKLAGGVTICRGCYKVIDGSEVVNAMDELWHPQCFKCHVCNLPITGGKFIRDGTRPVHSYCKH